MKSPNYQNWHIQEKVLLPLKFAKKSSMQTVFLVLNNTFKGTKHDKITQTFRKHTYIV